VDFVRFRIVGISLLVLILSPALVSAGPYAPAANEEGTTAVYKDDPAFGSWASDYVEPVDWGDSVSEEWKTPGRALGMAKGTVADVCSLGRGGSITLLFDSPVQNRDGWDFAVFENAVNDTFLELGYVEVSSNGQDFARFKVSSLTQKAVPSYGAVDPTDVDGFAGKYRAGYGTPFDLEDLRDDPLVQTGTVDINAITHIRIVDVIGDGSELDDDNPSHQIYDPYPTTGSAGFDLDAIGILTGVPTIPWDLKNGNTAAGGCFIATAAYGSTMVKEVQILRDFRDVYLLKSGAGRAFVNLYYRVSPEAAGFIARRNALRFLVRIGLLPVIGASYLMLNISAAGKWVILSLGFVLLCSGLIVVRNLVRDRMQY
jgi:hypothetical protein